jgi:TM2 domain-containing membrane protein YozV/cold shock CspA family protein
MRGKVLSYVDLEGNGLIGGDDGQRYPFVRGALQGGLRTVYVGAEVDFQIEEGKAVSIYVMPSQSPFSGDRNKIIAAILAFFLGGIGIHKFYLGKTNAGIIMLVAGTVGWILVLPAMASWLIGFIEFIIYLTKSDAEFYQDYVVGDRTWF